MADTRLIEAGGPGEACGRLAAQLEHRRHQLTRTWLETLETNRPASSSRPLPRDLLLACVPDMLADIASCVAGEMDDLRHEDAVARIRHFATERFEHGFDVQEVLEEAQVLGDLLFVDADGGDGGDARPVRRLHHALMELATIIAGIYQELGFRRQRDTSERIERFTRTLSHELKNPIGTAQGAAQLLCDEGIAADPEQRRRFAAIVLRSMDRAEALVEDVRALARLGHVENRAADIAPLRDVVTDVVSAYAHAASERNVRIAVDDDLPAAPVDRRRAELVLANLVGNAVKYSDGAKPDRWVRIAVRSNGEGTWRVEVRDNGVGIPESQRGRLFERFFRGATADEPGSGLGLAIAREAAHQIGAQIDFESSAGAGSSFRVVLPEANPPAPPELVQ